MAPLAVLSEASIMNVVPRMTVITGTWQAHFLHWLRMTCVALQAFMLAR